MNLEGSGKGSGLFKGNGHQTPGRLGETMKTCQDSRCPSRNSNRLQSVYKTTLIYVGIHVDLKNHQNAKAEI